MTIYFTSDLHISHENIIGFANRPFSCSFLMDEALIDNINAVVGPKDTLYILGDVCMGRGVNRAEKCREILSEINCKDVHLIIGNHDLQDANQLKACGFKDPCLRKVIKIDGDKIVLDHFPLAEWDGFYHGAYHLHGHIHSSPTYNEEQAAKGLRRFDVGVDANDYRPVAWEDIKEFFRKHEDS